MIETASEAELVEVAFFLTFKVTVLDAVDTGIKEVASKVVPVIAVQVVPLLIVYSIVVATLLTFSIDVSNAGSGDNASDLLYKVMLFIVEEGADAVALVLIFRITLAPSAAAGIIVATSNVVAAIVVQVTPESMEYSMAVVTAVTFSVVKLITELGATSRFARVIILASEATASSVGLTLIFSDTAAVAVTDGIKVETSNVVAPVSIAVQVVPFVLYCIVSSTLTFSVV